jgi:hypothetical protein
MLSLLQYNQSRNWPSSISFGCLFKTLSPSSSGLVQSDILNSRHWRNPFFLAEVGLISRSRISSAAVSKGSYSKAAFAVNVLRSTFKKNAPLWKESLYRVHPRREAWSRSMDVSLQNWREDVRCMWGRRLGGGCAKWLCKAVFVSSCD